MRAERVLAHFDEQAGFCAEYGSPFTAHLILRLRDDLAAGGPVAALVGDWPGNPRADVVALRLTGALHAAALTGRDAALAQTYPAAQTDWSMDEVWPAARAFLQRETDWVRDFIRSAPQTNETRRSIALLAAFLAFAREWRGPIDAYELGASAGLNLNWDRFHYRTRTWEWGRPSPVLIDTDWQAAPPSLDVRPNIRHRAGCDLNPLDIRDPAQRLQLKSYIWADQADRMARFDGAAELALQHNAQVERASADQWIAEKLAARAPDAAALVYHSVFLQYPPREVRAAIVDAIEQAGVRATPQAPLAWVRLEPEALTDGVEEGFRFVIDLITWPGRERRILGYTDGHVRTVHPA